MFPRLVPALFALPLLLPVAASAGDLAEAQTNYRGAIMLEGQLDAAFASYDVGDFYHESREQTEYAFWSGNTLYTGAEDQYGNGVDAIVEFYWFESSIDRGSDFYVAVIKARTTPNVPDGWYLRVHDSHPALRVHAKTDTSRGTGGFRWDWSVPFESYGIDSYGQVTMRSAYGLGVSAEGSAMAAETYEEDGASAEISVQTKGFLDSSYQVQTEYTVTLWSWNTRVQGNPGSVNWSMTLDNDALDDENAYHEYYLVMQSEAGVPFVLDELDIGAHVNGWWWGQRNQFSVSVQDIELTPPAFEAGTAPGDDSGSGSGSGGPLDEPPTDTPYFDFGDPEEVEAADGTGCVVAPAPGLAGGWLLLGLAALTRRRSPGA